MYVITALREFIRNLELLYAILFSCLSGTESSQQFIAMNVVYSYIYCSINLFICQLNDGSILVSILHIFQVNIYGHPVHNLSSYVPYDAYKNVCALHCKCDSSLYDVEVSFFSILNLLLFAQYILHNSSQMILNARINTIVYVHICDLSTLTPKQNFK